MKEKLFYLVVLFFTAMPAHAFEDPTGAMLKLDGLLGNVPFSNAFRTGDRVELLRKSCTGPACSTMNAHYDVVRADRHTAEVTTTVKGRTQPHRVAKISRLQWEEINGNRARDAVREIESYGQKVTVTGLRETSVTLVVNGRPASAPAYEFEFTSQSQIGGTSRHVLTLSPLCRGPGQIVLKIVDDGLSGSQVMELLNCQLVP